MPTSKNLNTTLIKLLLLPVLLFSPIVTGQETAPQLAAENTDGSTTAASFTLGMSVAGASGFVTAAAKSANRRVKGAVA